MSARPGAACRAGHRYRLAPEALVQCVERAHQVGAAAPGDFRFRLVGEQVRRDQLAAGARAAGLSRGAYLAGLIANVPVLSAGGGRAEHIATLMASCAELSTLSRNIHRLTALLRQANVEPARPYREMLDTLAGDVRRHLELAAHVLADLQPQSRRARPPARSPQ